MAQINLEVETSPLIISEPPKKNTRNCLAVLKDEFRLKNFGFNFENPGVFYKSQWQIPRIVFVIFRLCLAFYTGTICILTIVYFPHKNPHRPWPIWLTNWSYLLLTCHEICAAAIAVVHLNDGTKGCCSKDDVNKDKEDGSNVTEDVIGRRKSDDAQSLPCYMKLDWFLFCIAVPVAISIAFNILISTDNSTATSVKDWNNHVLNGVVALLDICVSAIPVRLYHITYIIIYYSLYHLFSYIIWSFDHTANVIYENMDWNDPANVAVGWAIMALVSGSIVQIIVFALYRLRLFIYTKIYGDEERGYEEIYDY